MQSRQGITTRRSLRRAAFTLMELTVVVLIMAIITALAVPRFGKFAARRQVDAAARRIATDVALAQRDAKFTSTNRKVIFDAGNADYTLSGYPDPNHPSREYKVHMDEEPYGAVIVSADFGGDNEIMFDGYGVPDSSGTVVIQVGAYQKTLTVDGRTGRVNTSDVDEVPGDPAPPKDPLPPEQS